MSICIGSRSVHTGLGEVHAQTKALLIRKKTTEEKEALIKPDAFSYHRVNIFGVMNQQQN